MTNTQDLYEGLGRSSSSGLLLYSYAILFSEFPRIRLTGSPVSENTP
jgi:hypothetical protein